MLEFLQRQKKPGQKRTTVAKRYGQSRAIIIDPSLQRKLRLIACGFCRRIWYRLPPGAYRQAIEWTERYADGDATRAELRKAADVLIATTLPFEPATREKVHRALTHAMRTYNDAENVGRLFLIALSTAWEIGELVQVGEDVWQAKTPQWDAYAAMRGSKAFDVEQELRASLLRDVIPSPFRKVAFDPAWLAWRNQTITQVARSLYEDYRFDELPILADALEEAGCVEPAILDHCRQPAPHVRGCWVLDLLLAKE